jgi:trans-aconitate methyltransferase
MPAIDEYTQLVCQSELKAAKVWGENTDRYFPDTETMISWVDQSSLVPFFAGIKKRFICIYPVFPRPVTQNVLISKWCFSDARY